MENPEGERLANEAAPQANGGDFLEYLETQVWPLVPTAELGRTLTREEEDEILGCNPGGY